MSVEIIPDERTARQRIFDLDSRLRVEKPKGKELVRLYKEITEAERVAFLIIPRSRFARNVTPISQRVRNALQGVINFR